MCSRSITELRDILCLENAILSVAATKCPSQTIITAPGALLLSWGRAGRLVQRANALIDALAQIGSYRRKAALDYPVTDDERVYNETRNQAKELLEQVQVTLRLLQGHTFARRRREIAAMSIALGRKLDKAHGDAIAVLTEVEKTLLFLVEQGEFTVPEPAPPGTLKPARPRSLQSASTVR